MGNATLLRFCDIVLMTNGMMNDDDVDVDVDVDKKYVSQSNHLSTC